MLFLQRRLAGVGRHTTRRTDPNLLIPHSVFCPKETGRLGQTGEGRVYSKVEQSLLNSISALVTFAHITDFACLYKLMPAPSIGVGRR